ncbi:DUF5412 family protein, partial [Gottfriedia luciferensis]|uniref:DUF5412 family protein n=1 Tax=Gottfriedia luciferensis TaxID=178774 RepID=UPI002E272DB5
ENIEKEIKKTKKKMIIVISILLILIVSIIFYGINWMFFDIDRLHKGEFIGKTVSPNGEYTIKTYLSDAGATTSYHVLGTLFIKNNKSKNIYWDKGTKANIVWIDNKTVLINGHKLFLPKDKYDYRRH